jgi:mono/diheme cytochrome c family protein
MQAVLDVAQHGKAVAAHSESVRGAWAPDQLEARMNRMPRSAMLAAACAMALVLGGCAIEWQNLQARREVLRASAPPGSVHTGWRVYQERCARCHGTEATGSANSPDLLVTMREMGPRRFVDVVLRRYDWNLPGGQGGGTGADREALIDQVLQRGEAAMLMPAGRDEPQIKAHVMDLYAFLAARAEGRQGPGRPAP